MAESINWHVICMKVYRFGKEPSTCYNIIILEDSGEVRVAFVGLNSVKEYIAEEVNCGSGVVRLVYGTGSSMPYKGTDGVLCDKYVLVYED